MPNKELLEIFPLYRKLNEKFYGTLDNVFKVAVHMYCAECKSPQTFNMVNEYYEGHPYNNVKIGGKTSHLRYVCSGCSKSERHFYIRFGPDGNGVTKIGQYPPWETSLSNNLAKALYNKAELYSRGMICESQSYGIAAFAYYRRIVEEIIDELLTDIGLLIPDSDKARYAEALAAVNQTIVAQDKIGLVKDLLPPILRPDNMNPLSVLHSALSDGLHARTDEECMEFAAETREVLVFLVEQVSATKATSKNFTASMRKLLERPGRKKAD